MKLENIKSMSDESSIQLQLDKISTAFHSIIEAAKLIVDVNNSLKLEVEKEKSKLVNTNLDSIKK